MHASPPVFGAQIVETILDDENLIKEWHDELILMSSRILQVRQQLVTNLKEAGSVHDWSHITN